jgi:GYF domain 2
MNWFYSVNGQQSGPVSDSQLDELLQSGKINSNTLVWHDGMTDWKPFGTVRPLTPPPLPNLPSENICVECGKTFAPGDLIRLNGSWVCAQCKPVFLQRLSEGVAVPSSGNNLWRFNKRLVTRSETVFPDRCVKCNAPADGFRLKRVLYWQHPAYLLLLLCNLLVLIIVVLIVRKKAVVHIGLCHKHRARRKQGMIIGWSSFLGGVVALVIAGVLSSGWIAFGGVLVLLAGSIYGVILARTVSATKITKENVWVAGVHRDFLADLPEWPGS